MDASKMNDRERGRIPGGNQNKILKAKKIREV
jgi:hypothetical protein